MASDQKSSGFCKHCNKNVMITRPGTSHILHLLMSIITAGIWLIIWLLSAIKIGGWRCSVCGKPVNRYGSPKELPPESTGPAAIEKKCPSCAEYVKKEALKCRFCSHEFPMGAKAYLDSVTGNPKKPSQMIATCSCGKRFFYETKNAGKLGICPACDGKYELPWLEKAQGSP